MLLSEKQKDSIAEILNISFSRAAKSLNELTGSRVLLSVPRIELVEVNDLEKSIQEITQGDVTTVHQVFGGSIQGDAFLVFDRQSSKDLVQLVLKENNYDEFSDLVHEVIVEVGNIILSACLSMFGNLLKITIKFSIPKISLDTLQDMIKSLEVEQKEIKYALIIYMEFCLEDKPIKGFLVLVMGVTSLEKFIEAVDSLG